jgi:glyoxylase-like metal-dependent hydrolase (beta-lactamase superfamily II)
MSDFTVMESRSQSDGPTVHGLHDPATGSWQYVCADPETRACAIVDPVLDFDPASARIATRSAQALLDIVESRGYRVSWILDTHPHADHMTAGRWLADRTGAPHAIGARTRMVAELWRDYYGMPDAFPVEGDFDRLFEDGDEFAIGAQQARVVLTPGHTLASIAYVIGDAAFVHDTLMHVDVGTSRADFPGGDAGQLYDSIQTLLALTDDTRLFVGHDYGAQGRAGPACEATVAEQRARNPHVGGGRGKADFVALREARDATLGLPDRMLYALQVNLRGGRLPEPDGEGRRFFTIPANRFGDEA